MNLTKLIRSKAKDDSDKLSDPDDLFSAATEALNRYSEARPCWLVRDLPGADSHDVALPAEWQPGFSQIQTIEYPLGNVPESFLAKSAWRFYASPSGSVIRLVDKLAVTATLRLTFSVIHTEATVPVSDLETVANLGASLCLLQLAATYGNSSDSTIQADSVNRASKTDEYRRLAKEFETRYKQALGLRDDDTVAPAMIVASAPPRRTRLTH